MTKRPASARAKLVEAQDAAKAALARFDSLFSEPFTLDDELTEETLDGTGAPELGKGGMLDGLHRGVGSTRGGRPRSARSSAARRRRRRRGGRRDGRGRIERTADRVGDGRDARDGDGGDEQAREPEGRCGTGRGDAGFGSADASTGWFREWDPRYGTPR